MPSIVIMYAGDDWERDIPLGKSPETREAFEEFYDFFHAQGMDVYRASILWYDQKEKIFSKAWTYRDKKWQRIAQKISPDIIFDKIAGRHDYKFFNLKTTIAATAPLINSPLFRVLFDNKLSQQFIFSQHMPFSVLAESQRQLAKQVTSISTETIVAKEVYGSGGKEVFIGAKEDLLKNNPLQFPLLLQEFVETRGVPGVSQEGEVADLRIVYIDHKPIYALSRIAKNGSLHTNFHQGASALLVPLEKVPSSCLAMAEKIKACLAAFPSAHYSLDFMFTTDGQPIFIEMNTTPGFDLLVILGDQKTKDTYFTELAELFRSQMNS